jgi:hypothetical protein
MRLLLAATLALWGTVCFAQEEVGTIAGAGWVSCGEYAQSFQENPEGAERYFFAWAQGYMSGVNQASTVRKNLRGWSLAKQKDHIRAFCDKRPLAHYGEAVQSVFGSLPDR